MKVWSLRNTAAGFLTAFSMASFAAATPSHAADYRMLSSWDQNYPMRKLMVDPFIKAVEEGTKGSVKIRLSGPETVPAFEQLQPTGTGVFHFLFTHGAYHFGTTPIATGLEALSGGLAEWRKAEVRQQIDKQYQPFGVSLVGLAVSAPGAGYNIILRSPVKPSGDLAGYKIRGTPTYGGILKALGASPVVLPPAEIYTSLEKGLVDGAAWPTFGISPYRWYEVAKYLLRPSFGTTTQLFLANTAAWNKFTQTERDVIMAELAKAEDLYSKIYSQVTEEEEKELVAKGMQIVQLGDEHKAKLADAWAGGLWDLSASKDAKGTDELRKFAIAKGLAK